MSLQLAALASGSNGNCYYIGNEKEAVLVDVGISAREVERRMKRLSLDPLRIRAIFISHEHTDHICGLQVFSKRHQVPVYITPSTLSNSRLKIDRSLLRNFTTSEPVSIGNISVIAFSKLHDAIDPYSFIIQYQDTRVGVFTDIGMPCQQVVKHFSQCHAAFLETNYDEEMLMNGSYPFHLKRRISSERGHLSNKQALELFRRHRPSYMSHLVLSHLSKNNNCPQLVQELFTQHAEGVNMIVASRYEPTALYQLSTNTSHILPLAQANIPLQMELSF